MIHTIIDVNQNILNDQSNLGTDVRGMVSHADRFGPYHSAHHLFAPNQIFLWLPGLPGEQCAFCSYNWAGGHDSVLSFTSSRDSNEALYSPPYPVSQETYVCWQTNVQPPFPFHAIPIVRSLSIFELKEIGRCVLALAEETGDPIAVLRNDRKTAILVILAKMGLLGQWDAKTADLIAHPRQADRKSDFINFLEIDSGHANGSFNQSGQPTPGR